MNNHHIYIVQGFHTHRVSEWRNIRAFTEEHHAAKYMESLQKENEPRKYTIAEVPLDVPMSGKLYFPTDNRILC